MLALKHAIRDRLPARAGMRLDTRHDRDSQNPCAGRFRGVVSRKRVTALFASLGIYIVCAFSSCIETAFGDDANERAKTNLILFLGIVENGSTYGYFAEANRFPMSVSWSPGKDLFPLDIWREEKRIRSLVASTRGIRDKMRMYQITIEAVRPSIDDLISHRLKARDFTNQWVVCFEWELGDPQPQTPRRFTTAAVFLDGALATRKLLQSEVPPMKIGLNTVVLTNGMDVSYERAREERTEDPALKPSNVGVGMATAFKYATEHFATSDTRSLTEITLHFDLPHPVTGPPADAVNQCEWMKTIIFVEPPPSFRLIHLETLLDGTIIDAQPGTPQDNTNQQVIGGAARP